MTEPSDNGIGDWPIAEKRIAPAAHVHAFGQISIVYPRIESALGELFFHYFPANHEYAERLFHKLANRERVDLLREIVEKAEKDAAALDAMQHAILCFNICTENRNVLMHVIVDRTDEVTSEIRMAKRSHNDANKSLVFQVPLAQLRQMADEMRATLDFIVGVLLHLRNRHLQARSISRFGHGWFSPLPDKPPKRHRLTPSLPEATP